MEEIYKPVSLFWSKVGADVHTLSGASLDSRALSVSSVAYTLGLMVVLLFASLVVGFFATSLMTL